MKLRVRVDFFDETTQVSSGNTASQEYYFDVEELIKNIHLLDHFLAPARQFFKNFVNDSIDTFGTMIKSKAGQNVDQR